MNKTVREVADELNLLLRAGVEHSKTCKKCKHDPVNMDHLLFFYGGSNGVLKYMGLDEMVADEAISLSMAEMMEELNIQK